MGAVEYFQQLFVEFDSERIAETNQNRVNTKNCQNQLTVSAPPPNILMLSSLARNGIWTLGKTTRAC